MDQLIMVARAVAETPERHLPLTQLQYAAVAVVTFVLMYVATLCFRGLWHRHDPAAFEAPHDVAGAGTPRDHHGHGPGH